MSARFVKTTIFLRNAQKPTVFSTILSEPWGFGRFELRTTCRRFVNKRRRGISAFECSRRRARGGIPLAAVGMTEKRENMD